MESDRHRPGANDPRRAIDEPKTVPPPAGAADAYSAQTRVATLPEDVLAAMRALEAGRAGGLRDSAAELDALTSSPDDTGSVDVHVPVDPVPAIPAPYSPIPPPLGAIAPPSLAVPPIPPLAPLAHESNAFYNHLDEDALAPRRSGSLARSLLVIALFGLFGALLAALLPLLDR